MTKIGILGTGRWGSSHVSTATSILGKNNVNIYDASESVLNSVSHGFGVVKMLSIDELIEKSDIVIVSVPTPHHYETAKKVILSKKPVMIEKPMCQDFNQASELVRLGELNNSLVLVDHLLVFHPAIRQIRQLILSGYIGDILEIFAERENIDGYVSGENVISSMIPHELYLTEYITSRTIDNLSVCCGSITNPSIDYATVIASCGDINAVFRTNWCAPERRRLFQVIGKSGSIVWREADGVILMKKNGNSAVQIKYNNIAPLSEIHKELYRYGGAGGIFDTEHSSLYISGAYGAHIVKLINDIENDAERRNAK